MPLVPAVRLRRFATGVRASRSFRNSNTIPRTFAAAKLQAERLPILIPSAACNIAFAICVLDQKVESSLVALQLLCFLLCR